MKVWEEWGPPQWSAKHRKMHSGEALWTLKQELQEKAHTTLAEKETAQSWGARVKGIAL